MTTDQNIIPYKVPDNDLVSYNESVKMYVTAVVYNASRDQWEKKIVIGNGSMYNYKGMMYYNAPLNRSVVYYSFVRAYSYSHDDSVSFYDHCILTLWFGIAESSVCNKWFIR